jgi:hypothetical protein
MELDLPTPVSHPPYRGNMPAQERDVPTHKNTFASIKNSTENCRMLYPWGVLFSDGVLYRERSCPSLVFEGRESSGIVKAQENIFTASFLIVANVIKLFTAVSYDFL